jgi:hypothetical protein
MDNLSIFIRQVRKRSQEHQQVMSLIAPMNIVSQMVSILRQELDSMVRVIYLLNQTKEHRNFLIESSVNGKLWFQQHSRAKITDKEMVEYAQTLQGWTQSVYKFGCAFIHLSSFHDYSDRDPLQQLPNDERKNLLEHCRYYHGGPLQNEPTFSDLIPYLPNILAKISGNLEYYLAETDLST